MKDEAVLYEGRIVPKKGFRVFVYGFDDKTKLVESWEEYQSCISSGVWFPSKDFPKSIKSEESDLRKEKKRGRD